MTIPSFYDELNRYILPGETYLDIHGAKESHGFDLCIGTGGNQISTEQIFIIDILMDCFKDYNVNLNTPFAADFEKSIPNYCSNNGAVGIQIEISRRLRNPEDRDVFEKFIKDFLAFSTILKESL